MPVDSGKILTTDCVSISSNQLLKEFRRDYKKIFLESKLEALGIDVELISTSPKFGGERIWFKCPECERKVEKIYIHPSTQKLGCRKCLNLDYASRRYKGMVEQQLHN